MPGSCSPFFAYGEKCTGNRRKSDIRHWRKLDAVCEKADLTETDRKLLWGRQFLNTFAFDDLEGKFAKLARIAGDVRAAIN